MFGPKGLRLVVSAAVFLAAAASARADLAYEATTTPDGIRVVLVSGEFAYSDDLGRFTGFVRSNDPVAVVFDSPGGNVLKAMQLGRLIRSHGLETIQFRSAECASACALAFLGGVTRSAEPGSIGVHRSSFTDISGMDVNLAVSEVQRMTAEVMSYMIEMGTDPGLLQLSFAYGSDDIRYLSGSEMERYRVTSLQAGPADETLAAPADIFVVPPARSGRIRHPAGHAVVKSEPTEKAADVRRLGNGTAIKITGTIGRWYAVAVGGSRGYIHQTWVQVDQYYAGEFDRRHIQVMSYDNLSDAMAEAAKLALPHSVYLASNGWFAVTLKGTFERDAASRTLRTLRSRGEIPADSFMTFGNTYVRQVCCE